MLVSFTVAHLNGQLNSNQVLVWSWNSKDFWCWNWWEPGGRNDGKPFALTSSVEIKNILKGKCGNEPQCYYVPLIETLLVKKGKEQGVQHFDVSCVSVFMCVYACVCI